MSDEIEKPAKRVTPFQEFRSALTALESQFKLALPSHIPADKFIRIVQTAVQTNPKLLEADRTSLYAACMKAAADGLFPDGREAALTPFKTTVVYIPMMAGILKKVRNSGELASLTANVVHEKDGFKYWIDEKGDHINHSPTLNDDRGDIVRVYAVAITKDGANYIEVMSRAEVEQVRNCSRAKDSGPWRDWYGEMAKKTAIRRLSKRLPMSTDLESVIKADDVIYELPPSEAPAEQTTTARRLGKLIADKAEPDEAPPVKNYAPGAVNTPTAGHDDSIPI